MKTNRKAKGFLIVFAVLAMFFLIAAIVMLLWNAILPDVTGVKSINFWQASGILLLSKILFGGFKGGKQKFRNWKERSCSSNPEDFTEEEREVFKQKLKERFGNSPFCRKKEDGV